jgi:hypothetical protein
VIDDDQGKTGSGMVERAGFATLLSAVCSGHVGAVLALEASRLARNNRDWHHLIDLCALTETLIIDGEGVYDPRKVNDRLVDAGGCRIDGPIGRAVGDCDRKFRVVGQRDGVGHAALAVGASC